MIIYSKSTGLNNSAIGKLETPIKMIIEHESDLLTKKGGICSWLFNVEKSHRFGETIIGQNGQRKSDPTPSKETWRLRGYSRKTHPVCSDW